MVVTVRFRDPLELCPDADAENKRRGLLPGHTRFSLAGQPVRVYLPPEPTMPGRCSEPLVWRVADEEVIRLCGELPEFGHVVVCAHQVDVD